jgi:hypothetical protein
MEALITLLLPLLIQAESSGDPNAIGDGGNAIGILQIWEDYWTDGTEYLKVDWPYKYSRDPQKAKAVTRAYLLRYGKNYERKTGKKITMEILARIHNGGPEGWNPQYPKKYKATTKYWNEKIKPQIKRIKK